MSDLAALLGGATGSSRPDFGAEERRERRRALARAVRRVMRGDDVSDDEIVSTLEDAFAEFKGGDE